MKAQRVVGLAILSVFLYPTLGTPSKTVSHKSIEQEIHFFSENMKSVLLKIDDQIKSAERHFLPKPGTRDLAQVLGKSDLKSFEKLKKMRDQIKERISRLKERPTWTFEKPTTLTEIKIEIELAYERLEEKAKRLLN